MLESCQKMFDCNVMLLGTAALVLFVIGVMI